MTSNHVTNIRDDNMSSDQGANETQKSVFDNSKVQEVLGLDNTWKPGKLFNVKFLL